MDFVLFLQSSPPPLNLKGKWIFFNISLAFLPKCVFPLVPASSAVPGIGPSLQKPFQEYLEAQRQKLHHRSEAGTPQGENWLSWMFEKLVVAMVCYFILSIINSMAQSYAKRIQQRLNSEEKTVAKRWGEKGGAEWVCNETALELGQVMTE